MAKPSRSLGPVSMRLARASIRFLGTAHMALAGIETRGGTEGMFSSTHFSGFNAVSFSLGSETHVLTGQSKAITLVNVLTCRSHRPNE